MSLLSSDRTPDRRILVIAFLALLTLLLIDWGVGSLVASKGERFDLTHDGLGKGLALHILLALGGGFVAYRYVQPLTRRARESQAVLSKALRRNELILQHAAEGIYGLDSEGRLTFVNPAAERMLGYTQEDLGQNLVQRITPAGKCDGCAAQASDCSMLATCYDGALFHCDDAIFQRKDGRLVEVRCVSAPIWEGGRVTGAVVVFNDITARRQVESVLRESEAHLARAQAQGKLGSWCLDIPNNVLEWSAENYRIFGLPPGTPLDYQVFLGCVHPDDREYVDHAWCAAMAGASYDIQHRIVADGKVKWVRERAELEYSAVGHLLRGVGTTQDITELKRHEDELLLSRQNLRELAAHHEKIREQERAHIAREIHDELGQYLTALRMDAAMLKIRFGADNPELERHADGMKETIDTTIGVVRNLATSLRPVALDMGLVSAAEWLLSGFEERTGIACTLHAPQESLSLDEERRTAAFRILQESLTNIARHAQAGGLEVRIELIDGVLEMDIRDDGVGFDNAEVRSRKTYGLMGMRERALQFGGESRIDSVPGAGTTVRIRIPCTRGTRVT